MEDCLQAALKMAQDQKFLVFPLYGIVETHTPSGVVLSCSCGNPACLSQGKHPAVSRGLNAASRDEKVIQNLWAGRVGLNVGIATGAVSDIFVIDVDGPIGEENLAKLEAKHGKLPKTLTSITARGKHLLFSYPGRKVVTRTSWPDKNIDVRGDGGYIVAPNSKHISGVRYQWEDPNCSIQHPPKWLIDMVCAEQKAPVVRHDLITQATSKPHDSWSESDVREMLAFISADCSRDEWLNIGMALHHGGYSFKLWDDWSKTAPHRYKEVPIPQWKSFKHDGGITMGTLVEMAKLSGWKPKGFFTEDTIDLKTHPARAMIEKIGKASPAKMIMISETEGCLPDNYATNMPGIIGDTIRWIMDVSPKQQPELCLMNVLATLGAVYGRRYALEKLDTRTNIYIVGIAPTGKGKDKSRSKLKEILHLCGYDMYLGQDNIKSGAGLIKSLQKQISQVMMIDEFGDFIESIINTNNPSFKTEITAHLMKLYSSSGSIYSDGYYATKDMNQEPLNQPALSVYGTTTEETYSRSMKQIAVKSGSLNRFIILKGRDNPQLNFDIKERGVPDHIILGWKQLIPEMSEGDIAMLNHSESEPIINEVLMGPGIEDRLRQMFIEEDKKGNDKNYGSLWVRYRENSIKVGMIFAITRNPLAPTLEHQDLDIGEMITRTSIEYMIYLAKDMMYENENERRSKEVFTMIKNSGYLGVARAEIIKTFRSMRKREIDDMILQLIDAKMIEGFRGMGEDKTSIRYRCI